MNAFAVLAEPNRRLILDSLLNGAQPVNALVDQCRMSQPVVSKHLRVLRDAGLVVVKPDGQRRLYSINPAPLAELEAWLEPYRRFWSDNLDALEQHLDEPEKKGMPHD
jgi:DNA-binding transcriptional ArsR family regulator